MGFILTVVRAHSAGGLSWFWAVFWVKSWSICVTPVNWPLKHLWNIFGWCWFLCLFLVREMWLKFYWACVLVKTQQYIELCFISTYQPCYKGRNPWLSSPSFSDLHFWCSNAVGCAWWILCPGPVCFLQRKRIISKKYQPSFWQESSAGNSDSGAWCSWFHIRRCGEGGARLVSG